MKLLILLCIVGISSAFIDRNPSKTKKYKCIQLADDEEIKIVKKKMSHIGWDPADEELRPIGSARIAPPTFEVSPTSAEDIELPRAKAVSKVSNKVATQTENLNPNVKTDKEGHPLVLSPQHCKMMSKYASMYGVSDVRHWVKGHCSFAKMYLPNASCEEINILIEFLSPVYWLLASSLLLSTIYICGKKKKDVKGPSKSMMTGVTGGTNMDSDKPPTHSASNRPSEQTASTTNVPSGAAPATTPSPDAKEKPSEVKKLAEKPEEKKTAKPEEKKKEESMKIKPYPDVKEPTVSQKKKKDDALEKEKKDKIAKGFYQSKSDEDDTLEKVNSLKEEMSEASKKKLSNEKKSKETKTQGSKDKKV